MDNRISGLPPESLQALRDGVAAARAAIEPHAVVLSAADRKGMLKLGDRSLAFVQKAARYTRERPELVPGFLDPDELGLDLETMKTLQGIAEEVRQLEVLVRDTATVAGGEAHAAALLFYRSVRGAARAGAPGAEAVRDDLGERFASRGSSGGAAGEG